MAETSLPSARLPWVGALLALVLVVLAAPTQAAAVQTMDARFGEGLYDAAAVWTGEEAYIFGGNDGDLSDPETDKIWRYDPATDAITETGAQLPSKRDDLAAIWDGQAAYLFGGTGCDPDQAQDLDHCDEVLRYEPGTEYVETVATLPRGDIVTAVWTGEHAYLFSGRTTDIYRFDPSTDDVTTLDVSQDAARGDGSAVWTGEQAIVFGGVSDRSILAVDPSAQTARTVDAVLPSARNLTAATWTGQHAYVFGGQGDGQSFTDEILRYDPASDTLDVLDVGFETGRAAFPGVWTGQHAFLFGGTEEGGYTDAVFRFTPTNVPPEATFEAYVDERTVTLDASASSDPDGTIEAYRWDLGDGNTSQGDPTIEHTYEDAGEHTVTLTVEDDAGATTTYQQVVDVDNRMPTATFEVEVTNHRATVDASNASDPDGEITRYEWEWGDGNASTGKHAEHDYAAVEGYTITLTVVDDDGGSATVRKEIETSNQPPTAHVELSSDGRRVTADASSSSDPDDTLTDFRWAWGDGHTSQGETSTHTYDDDGTYTVTLHVYDGHGTHDSDTASLTVENTPPTPNATLEATNRTVHADASNATDVDGEITEILWRWGDLSENRGTTADHTYAEHAVYTVTVRVTDDDGAHAWTNRTIDLRNQAPNVTLTLDVNDQAVRADASESVDPDGRIVSWTWRWGDGETTDGHSSRRHWYRTGGVYELEVTATDDDGASTTLTKRVTVGDDDGATDDERASSSEDGDAASSGDEQRETSEDEGPQPVDFVMDRRGRRVMVYAGQPDPYDGHEPVMRWRWGDRSGGATGQEAAHYYHRDGEYTITLTVDYLDGLTLTTEKTVRFGPAPEDTGNATNATKQVGATPGDASLSPASTAPSGAAEDASTTPTEETGDGGSPSSPHDASGLQRGVPALAVGVLLSLGAAGALARVWRDRER